MSAQTLARRPLRSSGDLNEDACLHVQAAVVAYESGLVRPEAAALANGSTPDAREALAGRVQDDLRGNGGPGFVSDR
jgi:hypothetical protein